MSVRPDSEQIETTRSEKALALILGAFILIGAVWGYVKLDEVDQPARPAAMQHLPGGTDRSAIQAHHEARRELRASQRTVAEARRELELTREAYRTALEAGEPAGALELDYQQAQAALAAAERAASRAGRREQAAAAEAAVARSRQTQARQEANEHYEDERRSHDRMVAAMRLGLVLLMLGSGYLLLSRMRRRRSRYLPLGLAQVGAATALAVVMAADYTAERIDIEDLGPLVLSLGGIAMTLAAYAGLQRYVSRRIPIRRVRRHECPFCGYPVRQNTACEGCGRQVVGECAACHAPRRVGTSHCGVCGEA